MRTLSFALLFAQLPALGVSAQPRYIDDQLIAYYQWFHEQSQVADLYTDGATLLVFNDQAAVQAGPCRQSEVVTRLALGQRVTNRVADIRYFTSEEIDGYGDLWFSVIGCDAQGQPFHGYLWGADVARGWRALPQAGPNALVMLGICAEPRRQFTDIKADLKVVADGQVVSRVSIPGLCVFEECATSPLVRVFANQPQAGSTVIETSTFAAGCMTGIEKAFYLWDGHRLQRVFHAEYTTGHKFADQAFIAPANGATPARQCRYQGEDSRYAPVWVCNEVTGATPSTATSTTARASRAR